VECLRSVTYADGDQIWFRAPVNNVSSGVAECVAYVVSGGALRRYMKNDWRNCDPRSGGAMNQTILLKGVQASGRPLFSYTLRYQPGLVQNQPADPAGCRTSLIRGRRVLTSDLPFISTVDIDLSGLMMQRKQAASAGLKSSSAITSHVAGDYAFATGCAP
jgi:hypothetical protein